MKLKILLITVLSVAVISCASKSMETKEFNITNSEGKQITVKAEIAKTEEERATGYMKRKNIPAGTGMLFVFEYDEILNFWMKDTPTALSIAYIDYAGKIRNIFDMKPYSREPIISTFSARYALEVPKGWFAENGIKKGDKIDLSPLTK